MFKVDARFAGMMVVWGSLCQAAQIDLQSSLDGSDSIVLSPAADVDINIVVITAAVDTIPIATVNARFNASNDDALVAQVTSKQNWTYDRSSFVLPASLNDPNGNEYGLFATDEDGGDELPLGSATHIIDTLTLTTEQTSGSTDVVFELASHPYLPELVGPAPTYVPFTIAPNGFPPGFPNFLYIGDPTSGNTPFLINYVPEPAGLLFLSMGVVFVHRRAARVILRVQEPQRR